MKHIIKLLLLTSIAGCSNPQRVNTGLEGKPLPAFNLLLSDSTTNFSTARIPNGQPVVLFYFGPFCPYSKAEMADILANMSHLKSVHFYVLTTATYPDMMTWQKIYHLENYPNVTLGRDSSDFFGNYFNTVGVPYLAVYDKQKHLKNLFEGKLDISALESSVSE